MSLNLISKGERTFEILHESIHGQAIMPYNEDIGYYTKGLLMYFVDSLTYPYNSEGFFGKLLIAILLVAIPLLNILGSIVLMGYGLKVISDVMAGEKNLPEFDFGADFSKGLIVFVATLLYVIPLIIIIVLLFALLGGFEEPSPIAFLLVLIISLVYALVVVAAVVRYAVEREMSAFTDIMGNINLVTSNPNAALMYLVNTVLLGIILSIAMSIGFALLFIPGLIIMGASTFSQFHLYAQYGKALGLDGRKRKVQEMAY